MGNLHALNIATKHGTGVDTLTHIGLSPVAPDWSPDGTEIAFNVFRALRTHLIDLQTRTINPLFPDLRFVILNAAWSPDGKKLVFAGIECAANQECRLKDFNKLTVYTVNRDGTGLEPIFDEAKGPVWSPRGDALLYEHKVEDVVGDFDQTQLFRLVLGKGKPKQLTAIGRNLDADWFDPAYALPVSPEPQLLTTTWAKVKKR